LLETHFARPLRLTHDCCMRPARPHFNIFFNASS
jgi:hypothetical protein